MAKGTIPGPGTVPVDLPTGWQTHEVTLMPFIEAPGEVEYTMCNKSGGAGTSFTQPLSFLVLR